MKTKKKVGRKPKTNKAIPQTTIVMTDDEYSMVSRAMHRYNYEKGIDLTKTRFFSMCIIDRCIEILNK